MNEYTFRTIIVSSHMRDIVKQLINAFAPGQGDGMFNTSLSPTGGGSPTHYITSGMISSEFAHILPLSEYEGDEWVRVNLGEVQTIVQIAQANGIEVNEGQIAYILSEVDVSTQENFQAMDRLGLKLITDSNNGNT